MPRQVDEDQRRRDIVDATHAVLAESGARGLSFRAVARKLGGSTSLITHYFPTQGDLLNEVTRQAMARWDEDIRELDASAPDPLSRLRKLLEWMIPVTEQGLDDERARIHLLDGHLLGIENKAAFDAWDAKIRGYIRAHVVDLVPKKDVESTVDLLRVTANGVVLSVVEHPDDWPRERQLAAMDRVLRLLGLLD